LSDLVNVVLSSNLSLTVVWCVV